MDSHLILPLTIYSVSSLLWISLALICLRAYMRTGVRGLGGFAIGFLLVPAGVILGVAASLMGGNAQLSIPLTGNTPTLPLFISLGLTLAGFMTIYTATEDVRSPRLLFFLYGFVVASVFVVKEWPPAYYLIIALISFAIFTYFVSTYRRTSNTTTLYWCWSWAFGTLAPLISLVAATGVVLSPFLALGTRLISLGLFLAAIIRILTVKKRRSLRAPAG